MTQDQVTLSKDVREEPLKSVISNCRRLIRDAEILLEHGSPGSALALAIMAFEEAGKGHAHELDARHNRRKAKIQSLHQFRHMMSTVVLMSSFHQKHGIKTPDYTDKQRHDLEVLFRASKTFSDFAKAQKPESARHAIGEALLKQFDGLDWDQQIVARVELQQLLKIGKAAATGDVEKLRQRGFYVDFDESGNLSRPSDVEGTEAYRWVWIAKRVVNLLAFGIYSQPYTELAAYIESLPKPLPQGDDFVELIENLQQTASKILEENLKPRAAEPDYNSLGPYEPYGESSYEERRS